MSQFTPPDAKERARIRGFLTARAKVAALTEIVDKHLTHRSPADKVCRDQLIASLTELMVTP